MVALYEWFYSFKCDYLWTVESSKCAVVMGAAAAPSGVRGVSDSWLTIDICGNVVSYTYWIKNDLLKGNETIFANREGITG